MLEKKVQELFEQAQDFMTFGVAKDYLNTEFAMRENYVRKLFKNERQYSRAGR